METRECFSPWVESEHESEWRPDNGLVWIVALAACLVVNGSLVTGAVYIGRLFWA
jgi:hypothetical protein